MRMSGFDVTQTDIRDLYLWLTREKRVAGIADHIKTFRRARGVTQKLDVRGTPRPQWAQAFVSHDRREDAEAMRASYEMLREIGLSAEEVQFCIANLQPLLSGR